MKWIETLVISGVITKIDTVIISHKWVLDLSFAYHSVFAK